MENIRNYLEADSERVGCINSVIYDRVGKGYRLEQIYKMKFSNSEVLALCKILLDSRAFTKKEMTGMLDKLISCCVPKTNQKLVTDLISNEVFHYVEPRHKTKFIDDEDVRKDFDVINDSFPTIYRIDRIKKLIVLEEKFHIPYSSRFEEGEFRKRVQFMYGGKLQKVKFKYSGTDIDAVLDRLPTAQIISEESGVYIVSAEVFGKGIDMWLRSQGEIIEMIG